MPITVSYLRYFLQNLPDDMLVFLAVDEEGNGYAPLEDYSDDVTLENVHSGDVQQALVLWPGWVGNWESIDEDGEE